MRLEQRNAGRLEGKVVVYGRCDDALEERILGFYLTSDLDELTKKTGSASATEVVEEALNKWYVQKSDDPTDVMVLYACAIAGPSIEAVAQRTCDRFFVGEYASPKNCLRAAQLGAELYVLRLGEQVRRAPAEEPKKQQELPRLTYKDIATESLKSHLQKEYIVPLFHAIESRASDALSTIKGDLLRFGTGAHFYQDVQAVCGMFEIGRKMNLPLLQAYLDKIDAISNEKLEQAAELRDRISQLSKQG